MQNGRIIIINKVEANPSNPSVRFIAFAHPTTIKDNTNTLKPPINR